MVKSRLKFLYCNKICFMYVIFLTDGPMFGDVMYKIPHRQHVLHHSVNHFVPFSTHQCDLYKLVNKPSTCQMMPLLVSIGLEKTTRSFAPFPWQLSPEGHWSHYYCQGLCCLSAANGWTSLQNPQIITSPIFHMFNQKLLQAWLDCCTSQLLFQHWPTFIRSFLLSWFSPGENKVKLNQKSIWCVCIWRWKVTAVAPDKHLGFRGWAQGPTVVNVSLSPST